jgi:hypothetical protein
MENKHSNIKLKVLTGILFGFIATAFGFYFYSQVFNHFSMKFIKRLILEEEMLSEILAYSAIPNLLAFFVFIKRGEDYKARGVIIATMIVAITIAISLVYAF